MISYQSVLITNGMGILLLMAIIFNTRIKLRLSLTNDKVFYAMVMINIFQCILETLSWVINAKVFTCNRRLALLINGLLFINVVLFALLWSVYIEIKLYGNEKATKKHCLFLSIPAIIIAVFVIINQFVPVFFQVSQTNVYSRTPAFFVMYLVAYLYLLHGTALIYIQRRKENRFLYLPAILFLTPVILTSLLQFIFFGISIMWIGTAIALTSLYINVQNEISSLDPLSGLYSKAYFNQYLKTIFSKKTNGIVFGVMLDVDDFKGINDNFGHLAGDEAIADVGQILKASITKKDLVARFAGDEFIIISSVQCLCEIDALILKINEQIDSFNVKSDKPYKLSFSIGYSILDKVTDTTDSFLARMDQAMYAEKSKYKNLKKII